MRIYFGTFERGEFHAGYAAAGAEDQQIRLSHFTAVIDLYRKAILKGSIRKFVEAIPARLQGLVGQIAKNLQRGRQKSFFNRVSDGVASLEETLKMISERHQAQAANVFALDMRDMAMLQELLKQRSGVGDYVSFQRTTDRIYLLACLIDQGCF